ncbi:(Dimethylallyl)adenosine tRNA methylthiotransferase MiaB [Methylobrevis pamukkalensis]|uniref:(Dimethylallyl)adenosine tRNA methylthiotransferase MiaB n=1 Tax=Methylobrevis pamukkalensis TaxID=1439726 RepID=A0A1E3GYS9_9HYPH|nr:(Dimethylallyl)adenosine tRNA methylthiotransferase MiaB [Methylobrevis pamukkalensis]
MFGQSLQIVDDCGLTHLHVFPYSPRPGTPAARMPQLAKAVIKERAARLRARGEVALLAHLAAETGRRRAVLVEKPGLGRTEQFTLTEIAGGAPGEIVEATITGHTGRALVARLAAAPGAGAHSCPEAGTEAA